MDVIPEKGMKFLKYYMIKESRSMSNIVLMVVDMQNAIIKDHPYNEQNVVQNIKKLIAAARSSNKEIIYVRHDDGVGTDLERGTEGWQIYDEVAPEGDEFIVEKVYNSAFHRTNLHEYLKSKEVNTIVLTGIQTEYCIDATVRSAFDYEYRVIVPEGTNTTYDNEYLTGEKLYEYYNYKIWNKRFAEVIPVDEVIELFKA